MKDKDIRGLLIEKILRKNNFSGDALLVEELGLSNGNSVVDLALITDKIEGFEIKSDQDTLQRLSRQQVIYNKILQRVTIVAATTHMKVVSTFVPGWWGIIEVESNPAGIAFNERRSSTANPCVDPFAFVQLIWKDEALQLLAEIGFVRGFKSKNRSYLWKTLVDSLEPETLSKAVTRTMKARKNWPRKGHR
jgi:hypothetical protein